jgi:hypothetical protein
MKRWITILLVFSVVLLLSVSCCGLKKIQTTTITVTKIDTLIKVVKDTVLKTVSVPFYDTAYIETETAFAKSYFNVKTQKIDLQLKGKIFEVPVQLQKTTYIKEKVTERKTTFGMWLYMFVVLLIFLFGIVITKKFQNLVT